MALSINMLATAVLAGMAGTSETTVVTIAGDLGGPTHPGPLVPAIFDTLTAWSPAVFDVHPLPTVSGHRGALPPGNPASRGRAPCPAGKPPTQQTGLVWFTPSMWSLWTLVLTLAPDSSAHLSRSRPPSPSLSPSPMRYDTILKVSQGKGRFPYLQFIQLFTATGGCYVGFPVQGLGHHFGPYPTPLSPLHRPSRTVRHAVLGGHAV